MKDLRNGLRIVGVLAVLFVPIDVLLNAYRFERMPKNFAAVRENVLYRSGQMRPHHLAQTIERYGIKTLICLDPDQQQHEEELAKRLGVRYFEYAMPGSGQGRPEFFHEMLGIFAEEEARPILVHCAAGAYRTGAAVALFRINLEGWTLEDAVREMKAHGYAGQQDLVEHIVRTQESVPVPLIERFACVEETEHAR